MKHALLTTLLAVPLLSACATDAYGNHDVGTRTMGGALIGGAVGALAGGAMGSSPVVGAAAGMVAGGAVGAATSSVHTPHRQYYRDTRGYCYYIDQAGQPVYERNVTC